MREEEAMYDDIFFFMLHLPRQERRFSGIYHGVHSVLEVQDMMGS
jgi:hypothetical protein